MTSFEFYENLIKENLSEHRYVHSLGVAKLARQLAKAHSLDEDKAYLAGILHDLTKEMPNEFHDDIFKKHNDLDKINEPFAIKHSHSCKYYLMDKFNINDEIILDAIYNHTICNSNSPYAKILYLADKREENRNINDHIIPLALNNLDEGYNALLIDVAEYLKRKKENK